MAWKTECTAGDGFADAATAALRPPPTASDGESERASLSRASSAALCNAPSSTSSARTPPTRTRTRFTNVAASSFALRESGSATVIKCVRSDFAMQSATPETGAFLAEAECPAGESDGSGPSMPVMGQKPSAAR